MPAILSRPQCVNSFRPSDMSATMNLVIIDLGNGHLFGVKTLLEPMLTHC